jgi:hypothetical protein
MYIGSLTIGSPFYLSAQSALATAAQCTTN